MTYMHQIVQVLDINTAVAPITDMCDIKAALDRWEERNPAWCKRGPLTRKQQAEAEKRVTNH